MKPKNVMLLGFVNRAIEYLDKHMDEEPNTRLSQLKNIDLASIKEELNNHLEASLGTMQSTMSTLLKAGNEAFDEFILDNYGKSSFPDQLSKMFDVDFDEEDKVDAKQDELAKLLSFYNLELEPDVEFHEDDVTVNDDEFMKEIISNVSKETNIPETVVEQSSIPSDKASEELDSIFSEIVENENNDNTQEIDVLQTAEEQKPISDEVKNLIDELRERLNQEKEARKKLEAQLEEKYKEETIKAEKSTKDLVIDENVEKVIAEEENSEKDNIQEPAGYKPYISSLMEKLKDEMIEKENKQQEVVEEEVVEEPVSEEPYEFKPYFSSLMEELKDKMIEDEEKIKAEQAARALEIQEEMARKAAEEKALAEKQALIEAQKQEELAKQEAIAEEEANKPYVSTLIEELKQRNEREEAENREKEIRNKQAYENLAKKYSHLPIGFVKGIYDLKESLDYDYHDGQNLIVLHRISFDEVDDLRKFVEICMNHNYNVNADENKMIVDTFREINNGENKILDNIYEIANQASILKGTYEGYNVLVNDID